MAAHQRVRELEAYMVPCEGRECPEHTFLEPFDRNNLRGKAKDYPVIWEIAYALLNAIGGILILESSDTLTEIEWDVWRQSCCDYLQSYMPENIAASIGFKTLPSKMMMFIPSSQKLMLYNMCITARSAAGNQRILDLDLLGSVMNRTSEKTHHLNLESSLSFDDEFPHGECLNREYKYWKVRSLNEIVTHITPRIDEGDKIQRAAKIFQRTLLAMANESCGGEVIIGIYEDRQQRKLLIKGLHLQDSDREAFEDKIDEVLKTDPVTGEPRVWREPGRFPEKNTQWRVSYHDVIRTPDNERRVITRIQIDHYPGGVFEVEPIAYDIDQNGYVTQKPFFEWREGLSSVKITVTGITTSSRPEASSSLIAVMENMNQKRPHSEARVDDGTTYVEADDPETMNAALKDRVELSWTKDKLNWSERIGDSEVNMESYITSESCFALDYPLNFNPPKERVLQYHPDVSAKIQEVEKCHQSDKGFVICVKSWMSHIMGENNTPKGHIMDLLVLVQKNCINKGSKTAIKFPELHLWVICGTAGDQKDDWRYVIQTSLSLKQQLIEGGCPGLSVICHTLSGDDIICLVTSGHQEEIMKYLNSNSEETVGLVKKTLSKILFQKEFYFTTTIGNQALIKFTEEQAKSLFMGEFSRITSIRGPPGSGKTILAQYIAKQYIKQYNDPNKVLFICTTDSFQKYIIFSLKCRTCLMKMGTDFIQWIQSEGIGNIECLIFDDVHNLKCTKEEWYTILKRLLENQKNIHFFADPFIQVYKDASSMEALDNAIHQIKKDHQYLLSINERTLTDVHRNTRKVTSFIINAVSANTHPDGIQIKAAHTLDGDDIETMYKGGLRLKEAENDLVVLIQELKHKYQPRDMAVLLGGENAVADKNFYTKVLHQHLDCEVHGADYHPREGVQVDVVDEYAGLEAAVVIHLNSKPTPNTQIDNPKYRSFIASRGIFRVIFLIEEPLNHLHYKQVMNLDKPLKLDAASLQHGKSSNKKIADDLQEVEAAGDINETLQISDDLYEAAAAGDVKRTSKLLKQGADVNAVGDGFTALCRAAAGGQLDVVKLLLSHGANTQLGDENPLAAAARQGHLHCVQWLLENGADVNVADDDGNTALCAAAAGGQLDMMKLLLSHGADIELGRRKPLTAAAQYGHLHCVQWLLENGADVNAVHLDGVTALRGAAAEGQLDVAKLLLSHGADTELGEWKPLAAAAQGGHLHCVQWLLENGADVNGVNVVGTTALYGAAARGQLGVMKLLLSHGADTDLGRRKPLTEAALRGHLHCVQWLLQNGADVNAVSDGNTALCRAAGGGQLDVMKLLVSHGADTELGREKPLTEAAGQSHLHCVQWLLENGADVNVVDHDGNTALCSVALYGQLDVMKLLVSHGADIELGRRKPLSVAAHKGHSHCVQWLLENGADVNGVDRNTALYQAAAFGRLDVVKLLLSHGADIDLGREKPLAAAAQEGHLHCVQWLLENGADVNAVDDRGDTALFRAAAEGQLEVMKLLLSHGANIEWWWRKPLTAAAQGGHLPCVQWLLENGYSQEAKNQALTAALDAVRRSSWNVERKAKLDQIVTTLRSHGAVD